MKAPQVNAWWVNKLNGQVMFEYEFDQDDKSRVIDLKTLSSEVAADNYLMSLNRSWLMNAFENWLNHKRHIIAAYKNDEKQTNFNEVWAAYCDMCEKAQSLEKVCARIIKGKDKIFSLLPATTNPSYDSSTKGIMEIFTFCEKQLLPKNTA